MQLGDWNEFNSLRSSEETLWGQRMPRGLTTSINVFKARFDIAARLESMTFAPEFGDDTTQAYLVGTKLLLAYSAGEAYMRAEDLFRDRKSVKITTWSISQVALARNLLPLVRLILEKADVHGSLNISTQKYLLDFCEGEKSNVRPIATALRHVHAHGGLTARSLTGAADNQGDGYVKSVDALAQVLLEKCDEKFSGLVKEMTTKLYAKE